MTDPGTDPPYAVAFNIDAPRDPQYLLEVLEAAAEAVRVANHQTLGHEALRYPSEADTAIRYLATLASRLPQLLEQVSGWLQAEQAAGRIEMAHDSTYLASALAADAARLQLEQAQAHARMLQQALDAAAAVTCDMAGVEDAGSEEGSG